MYTCANCNIHGCKSGKMEGVSKNCPCKDEIIEESKKLYKDKENMKIAHAAAEVEGEGYCKWTRLQEIMEFSRKCAYKNLGIAFCIGLKEEVKILTKILKYNGFHVNSIVCKNGAIDKSFINIEDETKLCGEGFEAMCNPIGQALFLNKSKTDFNILLGLCVGHDSLFIKYSKAPITVLVAKDRVLAHNPIGALYQAETYYKNKLFKNNNIK
ncbi:DUF1847 domain-containing protein [Clostridium sporogenes]